MDQRNYWRACSICKAPIDFGTTYHRCSVSTCNRKRTQLTFCSVKCWDAHVPTLRHRDAWAVEETAPGREAWEADRRKAAGSTPPVSSAATVTPPARPARRVVAPSGSGVAVQRNEAATEILIVASKLKKYIKQRSGLRTSDGVMYELSELVRMACDEAIQRAREEERTTVLDRDIPQGWRPD